MTTNSRDSIVDIVNTLTEGVANKHIALQLARFGITNPDALPEDVRRISDTLLNIYHAVEKNQLAQYPAPDWKSVVV